MVLCKNQSRDLLCVTHNHYRTDLIEMQRENRDFRRSRPDRPAFLFASAQQKTATKIVAVFCVKYNHSIRLLHYCFVSIKNGKAIT